ncbi:MAG: NAD(P)/FAD-dependent oxidoreductase [Thermoplasmata archaeon]|jgi:thioredoxin reductase (NADPH)
MIPQISLTAEESNNLEEHYELVIIGGGPAGLSAGIYAKRSGLNAVIIDKNLAGGLVSEDPLIENYLGFRSISGEELASYFRKHASDYLDIFNGIEVKDVKIDKKIFLYLSNDQTVTADSMIIATGTTHKKLGVKGEEEYYGKGVSYCVTCDAYLFKNKKVAVIGGGNSGAIAALYLKDVGVEPTIIEYMPRYMCEKAYVDQIKEKNIEYIMNAQVLEIKGSSGKVSSVYFKDRSTNEEKEIKVDGVFIYVGLIPQTYFLKNTNINMDQKGYVIVDKKMRTNIKYVYAAGDVTGESGQIIISAGQGAVAALSAYEDLRIKK